MPRRDDDYLRKLLINFEESDDYQFIVGGVVGLSPEEAKEEYHVLLACDAGLMLEQGDSVFRLTSQGHDYIAAIRSDTIWKKTKDGAEKVGGVTLAVMKDIAVAYAKQELSTRLGLNI